MDACAALVSSLTRSFTPCAGAYCTVCVQFGLLYPTRGLTDRSMDPKSPLASNRRAPERDGTQRTRPTSAQPLTVYVQGRVR